jgi:two-component system, chemotaxis family, response regulator WspF
LRIGIVNDVKMIAEALRRMLISSEHEVAWIAYDGGEAVAAAAKDQPDLILMDLLMPVMDGVEATRQIMRRNPCPILIVTANVEGNATEVFKAMSHGALDVVSTPAMNPANAAPLLAKIKTIAKLTGKAPRRITAPITREEISAATPPTLVLVAASTGGPGAVAKVFSTIESIENVSVILIQHIDAQFAEGLATWLSQQSKHPVMVATENSSPQAGKVLLAGTNDHLVMTARKTLSYRSEPLENPFRPSASVFFESVAANWGRVGVAVVLTGMGNDGAEGLLALKKSGWITMAQDAATSVIFGMPKAAAEIGAAGRILPLDAIGPAIEKQVQALQRTRAASSSGAH